MVRTEREIKENMWEKYMEKKHEIVFIFFLVQLGVRDGDGFCQGKSCRTCAVT